MQKSFVYLLGSALLISALSNSVDAQTTTSITANTTTSTTADTNITTVNDTPSPATNNSKVTSTTGPNATQTIEETTTDEGSGMDTTTTNPIVANMTTGATETTAAEETTASSTIFEPTTEPTITTVTTDKTDTTPGPQSTTTAEKTTEITSTTTPKVTTTAPETTTTDNPMSVVLPICLTIFGLVLVIFLIVLYMYCTGKELPCFGKRRREDIIEFQPRKESQAPKFVVGNMSIDAEAFEGHHKRKVADDGRGYREEFKAVQTASSTMAAARDPTNAGKNRYDNVLPWDTTRVVLSSPDGTPGSDYINANYVPGYLQEKKFIACQGPMESTLDQFWQMIWEQKCATIVMVTNLVEAKKIKCHQYWPGEDDGNGDSEKYGDYSVTTVDVKIRNYYVMRTLKLQYLDNQPRMIRQLHYIAWPDFGVPKNPHELLLFRRRVIAANPPHSGPIVVHCSAGVGRTGTYILVDAMMEQLQAEGKVDLYSFLTKMRKHRMMLVQTDAQYTFAHASILEYIKYGDTEVPVKKYRAQVQGLRECDEGDDEVVIDKQFSSLLKVQMNKDNMKHGRQSIKKNRVLQIIPYDDNRVTLPFKPGQEKSDYINASFIDGFKDKRAFIATQGPLNETAADFWTMIWVHQAHNIVMLTGLIEKGHEMCAQYWPTEINEEKSFGDISVKYISKDDDDVVDYVVREFEIKNTEAPDAAERKVRQFHYTGWPEVGLPSDAHGMIEISNRLTAKDKDGYVRPSVVHCSSGGGRTGVFIALNIVIEQADTEGLVDVFQTVKALRAQRPHIIQSQEQLFLCYMALLQYLETNQLAGDNTTLSSNINSSIGNHSESVAASTSGTAPSTLLQIENTTPQGSMNNKLDINSTQGSIASEQPLPPPPPSDEVEQTAEVQSPTTLSTDSVNTALLKQDAENGNSSSSQSDFEIVNENGKDIGISV